MLRFGTSRLVFTLAFGVVSACLARLTMHVLGTSLLDPWVANMGVAIAGIGGALASLGFHVARERPGGRGVAWAILPSAGVAIGMAVQGLLLVTRPEHRYYVIADGITSRQPFNWVLVGAPMGAVPTLVGVLIVGITLRLRSRAPALDATERMLVPVLAGSAILHALALGGAEGGDVVIVSSLLVLSVAALVSVYLADRRRVGCIRRIFAHQEPSFTLDGTVGAADVPLVASGIQHPSLVIVTDVDGAGYRSGARRAVAAAAETADLTLQPILRRRRLLEVVFAVTVALVLLTRLRA